MPAVASAQSRWYSIAALAERWDISPATVERLLRRRNPELVGRKIGGQWRVSPDALAAYEAPAMPAAPAAHFNPAFPKDAAAVSPRFAAKLARERGR